LKDVKSSDCGEEKVKKAAVPMCEEIRKQVMYLLFLDSFI